MALLQLKTRSVQLLRVEGIAAPIEVRRHPNARRMTLRVSRTHHAVILTVPQASDLREADRFLARNREWVRERLEHVPSPAPFRHGLVLPLRGVPHEVVFAGLSRGRGVVSLQSEGGQRLPRLVVSGASEHAPRRLMDWLVREAERDIGARVHCHTRALGVRASRVTIRDQKSRWGSCSSNGQLSFSWRLIMAPPMVLDYVTAHEVAHLVEMNHGPRFWRLVERLYPRLDEAKAWLRIHGMDLYRYGVER